MVRNTKIEHKTTIKCRKEMSESKKKRRQIKQFKIAWPQFPFFILFYFIHNVRATYFTLVHEVIRFWNVNFGIIKTAIKNLTSSARCVYASVSFRYSFGSDEPQATMAESLRKPTDNRRPLNVWVENEIIRMPQNEPEYEWDTLNVFRHINKIEWWDFWSIS